MQGLGSEPKIKMQDKPYKKDAPRGLINGEMRADVLDGVSLSRKSMFIYDPTCGKRYSRRAWFRERQVTGHDQAWFGRDQRCTSATSTTIFALFRMRQVSGCGDAQELSGWQGAAQRHRHGRVCAVNRGESNGCQQV